MDNDCSQHQIEKRSLTMKSLKSEMRSWNCQIIWVQILGLVLRTSLLIHKMAISPKEGLMRNVMILHDDQHKKTTDICYLLLLFTRGPECN